MFWGVEAGNGTFVFPRRNTIEHESGRNTQSRADRSLKYYNICYLRKSGKDLYNGHNVAKGGSGMKTNFLYGAFILCQLPFSFFR